MSELLSAILLLMRLVVFALALGLTLVSFQSYREKRSDRLKSAFIGFTFLSIGVAFSTMHSQLATWTATLGIVETIPFTVGFGMLYTSLYR